jgi:hypothetical protein
LETAWGRLQRQQQQQQQQQQQGLSSVVAEISKSALESFHSTHSLRDFNEGSDKSYGNSETRGSIVSGISNQSAWTIGAARCADAPADAGFTREYSRMYTSADGDEAGGTAGRETLAAQPNLQSSLGGSSTEIFGSASDATETASKAAASGGLKGIIRSMWRGRA